MECDVETSSYFIIWTFSVLFSIYNFSSRAKDYFHHYKDEYHDFSQGIEYLSTRRDRSDLEWESIDYLLRHFLPGILIYVAVAEICKHFIKVNEVLQIWQISFTVIFVLLQLGFISLFILLVQPVLFCTFKYFGTKAIHTWVCSGISIAFLTLYKSLNTEDLKFINHNEYESYLFTMALFWLNLKCTSYFLEQPKLLDTLEFFSYSLYPPTFFTGPCILFENFQYQYMNSPLYSRLKKLAKNIITLLFWFVFVNVCLHFTYVNASSLQPELIKSLDSWSLYGYGYTMGQYFHLKYIVLYGISTSIASFENVEVPHLPRCIGRIHLYSDMWKYFDPGLYKFLSRHIYVPFIRVFKNKSLASLLCFCFVYIWHGLEQHILIWAALNFLGIMIESFLWPVNTRNIRKSPDYCTRQFDCFLAAPLLAVSAISSFYFFAGKDVGDIFTERVITDKLSNTLILLLILYCCCQVSTQLRTVTARKM